ncbi:PadR family transcriptional regulator [Actinophytocola sp.]|uniref:PadR family transcriptional regulator n=1 Tax=Actinophytocola sp. TaxID=1872138 RepID=UPI002ED1B8EC
MWIEVMLLSKLSQGPAHGYELRKDIEASTGHALSNNSLYPALRRFVESGAVTRSAEMQEAKPPRHVYTITDVGRELFHDLLADLPEELARNDSEFLARVANFAWLRPEEQLQVLDVRERAVSHSRERLGTIAATQADPWQRKVLDHICGKFDIELAWLADLRDEIQAKGKRSRGKQR